MRCASSYLRTQLILSFSNRSLTSEVHVALHDMRSYSRQVRGSATSSLEVRTTAQSILTMRSLCTTVTTSVRLQSTWFDQYATSHLLVLPTYDCVW